MTLPNSKRQPPFNHPMRDLAANPFSANKAVGPARRYQPQRNNQPKGNNQLRRASQRRQGMALIIVMVATVFLALAAYAYTAQMQAEYRAARAHMERAQAKHAALSGIQWTLAQLDAESKQDKTKQRRGIEWVQPLEEPSLSRDDSSTVWQFALLSPKESSSSSDARSARSNASDQGRRGSPSRSPSSIENVTANEHWRFGLENLGAKIHIPTLQAWEQAKPGHARRILANLPGATPASVESLALAMGIPPASANATNARGRGRGRSRASRPPAPAAITDPSQNTLLQEGNAQVASLWNGGDWNQNYQLDSWEAMLQSRRASPQPFSQTGSSNSNRSTTQNDGGLDEDATPASGWERFFSWHSAAKNVNRDGLPRTDINQPNLAQLHQTLSLQWPAEWANFVIAYRQYGPARSNALNTASGQEPIESTAASWTPNFSTAGSTQLQSLYDLIDAVVEIPTGNRQRLRLRSPFSSATLQSSDYLEKYLDAVTVNPNPVLVGSIDILEAPAEVLMSIPDMPPQAVEQILAKRSTLVRGQRPSTCGWLLSQGIVDLPTMRSLDRWICCRNDIFRVQVLGFQDAQHATHRCRVVLDASSQPARLIEYQEWQGWDIGFDLDTLTTTSSDPTESLR